MTKAGKKTYGLDRFYSSLYGQPVPGSSFFSLSLISVKARSSYPMMMETGTQGERRDIGEKEIRAKGSKKARASERK